MPLIEPQRWIQLMISFHQLIMQSEFWSAVVPVLADIFVFTYPLYLVALYSAWWIKKEIKYKVASLWIFIAVLFSTMTNILIQVFFQKSRPNILLGLSDQKSETILHSFLPSSSFPSDHAVVSMSIAVATLLRWIEKKDKKFLIFGIILLSFSLIMSISRVGIAVHRPTDIIGWFLVWATIPLILSYKKILSFSERILWYIAKKI